MSVFASELIVMIPFTLCKALLNFRSNFCRSSTFIVVNSLSACMLLFINPKSRQQFANPKPQSLDTIHNPSRAAGTRTLCAVQRVLHQQTGSHVSLQLVAAPGRRSHACFRHRTALGHLDSALKSYEKTFSATKTHFRLFSW